MNGVPSCANGPLLSVALDTWGFDGYITSDCGAVQDVYNSHAYAKTQEKAAADVLNAGMDIDCQGQFTRRNLVTALNKSLVTMAKIDGHLTKLFSVQMRLGMYDPVENQPYTKYTPADVATAESVELARDGARQGIVLLKNTQHTLPLDPSKVRCSHMCLLCIFLIV